MKNINLEKFYFEDLFKSSLHYFKKNIQAFVLISLLASLVLACFLIFLSFTGLSTSSLKNIAKNDPEYLYVLPKIILIFIFEFAGFSIFLVFIYKIIQKIVDGKNIDLAEIFHSAKESLFKTGAVICANLVITLAVIAIVVLFWIGFYLTLLLNLNKFLSAALFAVLVIASIYFAINFMVKIIFYNNAIAVREKSGIAALKYSKFLVKNNWWKVCFYYILVTLAASAIYIAVYFVATLLLMIFALKDSEILESFTVFGGFSIFYIFFTMFFVIFTNIFHYLFFINLEAMKNQENKAEENLSNEPQLN